MRIALFSDLHLELWRQFAPRLEFKNAVADVVVLAGDIHTGARAVAWARDAFPDIPVLYVAGNHEAYGLNLEPVLDSIQAAAMEAPNVQFLDCAEFQLAGVRFLGATLWTDFELFGRDLRLECWHEAEKVMNDYRRIRLAEANYRCLRAGDTVRLHLKHRTWLARKLEEPFDGKTVVVTHMAPSIRSISDELKGDFRDELISAAYASNLEVLAEQANLWLHGHVHHSVNYQIGKCRVLTNPCGYMMRGGVPENHEFDPSFVVQV